MAAPPTGGCTGRDVTLVAKWIWGARKGDWSAEKVFWGHGCKATQVNKPSSHWKQKVFGAGNLQSVFEDWVVLKPGRCMDARELGRGVGTVSHQPDSMSWESPVKGSTYPDRPSQLFSWPTEPSRYKAWDSRLPALVLCADNRARVSSGT